MPRARLNSAARRAISAAILVAALAAVPADAAITTTVDRSGVSDAANPLAPVKLERNGIVIGRAATDDGGDVNINGGACWSGYTPEVRPGDTVRVGAAGMVVRNIAVTSVGPDGSGLNTVVTGTAASLDGLTVAVAGQPPVTPTATATGWTATFPGTHDTATATATGADGGTTVVSNPPGKQFANGCDALAPFHPNAIANIDAGHVIDGVPTINIANASQPVVLTGPGNGALDVAGTAPALSASGGTWTASFSAAGLPEGPVTASLDGTTLAINKDTVAPGPPTGTPAPGRYLSPPSVYIAPPEPGAVVHYTTDGSTPTMDSPVFTLPVTVTASQTLRAFAVDGVGNTGPLVALPYQIGPQGGGGGGDVPGVTTPPGTGGGTTTPAPRPKIASISVPRRLTLKGLRARGLRARVNLGQGTTAVRFTVYRSVAAKGRRRLRLVASIVRVPGRSGPYTAKLNARAVGLTKPGLYQLKIVPGLSRSTLEQSAARTVWIRVLR